MQRVAEIITEKGPFGGLALISGGYYFTIDEIVLIAGVLFSAVTCFVNWWFKSSMLKIEHKKLKMQDNEKELSDAPNK